MSKVTNGSPMMTKVTGMGCTATAIVGACIAVEPDMHLAALAAMAIMGVCGDKTNRADKGPGAFQSDF